MKAVFTKILVVFLVTISLINAQNNLAYNLKVGDQFKVKQVANQDIVQDMNGQKHIMKNLLEGDFSFVVEDVNDSLYGLKFKFDRFKMLSSSNRIGEIMSINTNDTVTDDDIEGKIFSQLVSVNLTMTMYKNGKIKSIEGSDELISKMVNAVGALDELTKEVMRESMKGEFSNESLAMSFEQMTYIYPNETIAIGDTWKNNFEGELSSKNTWTLNSITHDGVNITGESSVIFKNTDADVEMNLNGDMSSNLTTSPETGFVKTMTTSSTVKGNSIMHNMDDLEVPTTIISNVTYKTEKHVQ
ncbi:hypothetical protein ES692_01755 [Psychroserpens burtonensis]|uniref:Uncharacterized protein n=1 Tax=Psychroserpens burtonensis TaxID=49278 RepID=A0A5C7BCI2_9FLAO|nr:DUF6263 family protein [Psychroserpens burtonensis]TXE20010.1 hypothetical protein ES692_01755 [Psychroserpens burtonensis]